MSAPLIWIAIPFLIGVLILLVLDERISSITAGIATALLSLVAFAIPIDQALLLGSYSFKISASISILGRSFVFNTADGILLATIYGSSAIWFFGAEASNNPKRFAGLGLIILSLFTASIAVEPFLFAALLLEIASMLAVPLLNPPYQKPGRGTIRFIISQTLAMPFILFSGWMLAGVEASPGDLSLTTQSAVMLGLGFAFLLAIFPLYSWIPMIAEESSPYITGFLLWLLTTFTIIFALGFLDHYAWLRSSAQLSNALQTAGLVMVVSGGLFALTQKHVGRIMGYTAIAETGLMVLSLSLRSQQFVPLTFLLLIPRGLELAVWALALSLIKREAFSLKFNELRGCARKFPAAVMAILVAQLSMTGFPLFAGFPARLALSQQIAARSILTAFWVFVGLLGLLLSVMRTMAVFVMADENAAWEPRETWVQNGLLGIGVAALIVLGLFPQILQPILGPLPVLFQHLGQ